MILPVPPSLPPPAPPFLPFHLAERPPTLARRTHVLRPPTPLLPAVRPLPTPPPEVAHYSSHYSSLYLPPPEVPRYSHPLRREVAPRDPRDAEEAPQDPLVGVSDPPPLHDDPLRDTGQAEGPLDPPCADPRDAEGPPDPLGGDTGGVPRAKGGVRDSAEAREGVPHGPQRGGVREACRVCRLVSSPVVIINTIQCISACTKVRTSYVRMSYGIQIIYR